MMRRLMLMRGGKSAFEINSMFREAKDEAKSAGKLLACSLAIRGIEPIQDQSLSILGFSLGCQLTKTCLRTLNGLQANSLIQNVTFMGAAISQFDRNAQTQAVWSKIFSQTINGSIRNVYTKKDMILLLYTSSQLRYSTGRNQVMAEASEGLINTTLSNESTPVVIEKRDVFSLKNYDISGLPCEIATIKILGIGHNDYRDNLLSILYMIDFDI